MKRQRINPDGVGKSGGPQNIMTDIPKDVYHEIVDFMRPQIEISLEIESDEDLFHEYCINISLDDIFCVRLRFAVEIHRTDEEDYESAGVHQYDVVFMYGDNNSDEFSYDTISGYCFEEIQGLMNTSVEDTTDFPPFIHFGHGQLLVDCDHVQTSFNIHRLKKHALRQFKQQFDEMYKWILNG